MSHGVSNWIHWLSHVNDEYWFSVWSPPWKRGQDETESVMGTVEQGLTMAPRTPISSLKFLRVDSYQNFHKNLNFGQFATEAEPMVRDMPGTWFLWKILRLIYDRNLSMDDFAPSSIYDSYNHESYLEISSITMLQLQGHMTVIFWHAENAWFLYFVCTRSKSSLWLIRILKNKWQKYDDKET